jgi:hypothetical protein
MHPPSRCSDTPRNLGSDGPAARAAGSAGSSIKVASLRDRPVWFQPGEHFQPFGYRRVANRRSVTETGVPNEGRRVLPADTRACGGGSLYPAGL